MAATNDELSGLAATAATSMVSAMGTDLWPTVKHSVLRLLSRLPVRRTDLTAALEQHAEHAAAAGTVLIDGTVRTRFAQFWAETLEALVRQDPALLPELVDLAAAATGGAGTRSGCQRNTARDSGTVYANQHGSQYVHHSSPQEPK